MPLADVYAVLFTVPLLITALTVPLLGESVGRRRWTAVVVGFSGVLLMIAPATAADLAGGAALAGDRDRDRVHPGAQAAGHRNHGEHGVYGNIAMLVVMAACCRSASARRPCPTSR